MTINTKTMLLTISLLAPVCAFASEEEKQPTPQVSKKLWDKIKNVQITGHESFNLAKDKESFVQEFPGFPGVAGAHKVAEKIKAHPAVDKAINFFTLEGYELSSATAYKKSLQDKIAQYPVVQDGVALPAGYVDHLKSSLKGETNVDKIDEFHLRCDSWNFNKHKDSVKPSVVISQAGFDALGAPFPADITTEADIVAEIEKRQNALSVDPVMTQNQAIAGHYQRKLDAFNAYHKKDWAALSVRAYRATVVSALVQTKVLSNQESSGQAVIASGSVTAVAALMTLGLSHLAQRHVADAKKIAEDTK